MANRPGMPYVVWGVIVASWILLGAAEARGVVIDGRLEVVVTKVGTYTALAGVVEGWQVNLKALAAADTIKGANIDFVGSLYQLGWAQVSPPVNIYTPDMYNAQYLSEVHVDSHFLLNQLCDPACEDPNDPNMGDWSNGQGVAIEDNDFRYGPNAAGEQEGLGTTLKVSAFITEHARAQDLAFADIAIPAGGTVHLTGDVANGEGYVFYFEQGGGGILIPEPTITALFGLGALALVRGSRRPADA